MTIKVQNNQNENLQILRFFAAGLVLLTHITFYIHERISLEFSIWHNGEVGVPIFFVISGFVMQYTGHKFSTSMHGAGDFIRRRLIRIFPLYWLITTFKIAVFFIFPAVILHNQPTFVTLISSYLLFPMLNSDGSIWPIHGVAWTLLHEMFFYYLFTLALLFKQKPVNFCTLIIIFFWLLGLVVPPKSAALIVFSNQINLMFIAGMLLAKIYEKKLEFSRSFLWIVFIVSVMGIISSDFLEFKRIYFHNFYLEAVTLVFSMVYLKFSWFPILRGKLKYLGDSSYSLYLIHPIVAPAVCLMLYKIGLASVGVLMLVTTVITIAVASFVYAYIESPMNKKTAGFLSTFYSRNKLSPS